MCAGSSYSGSGSEDESEAAQRDYQAGMASQASLGAKAPQGAKAQDAVWNGSAWVDPSSSDDEGVGLLPCSGSGTFSLRAKIGGNKRLQWRVVGLALHGAWLASSSQDVGE